MDEPEIGEIVKMGLPSAYGKYGTILERLGEYNNGESIWKISYLEPMSGEIKTGTWPRGGFLRCLDPLDAAIIKWIKVLKNGV